MRDKHTAYALKYFAIIMQHRRFLVFKILTIDGADGIIKLSLCKRIM